MHHDLTRNALAVLILAALIALSLWVLRPFLAATVWATMIVVATWPWLISLQRVMRGHRAPAVALMSLEMLFLLVSARFLEQILTNKIMENPKSKREKI